MGVNFTLGDDAGKLIIDIAREHLLCTYDPVKAMRTIQGSLSCDKETALDILSGKIILTTDEGREYLIGSKYEPEIHRTLFPPLNAGKWSERKLLEIKQVSSEWSEAISELRKTIIKNSGEFDFSIRYEDLIKFFYDGDPSDLLEHEIESGPVENINFCVKGIKNFITESMKIISVIKWLSKAYPEDVPEGFCETPKELKDLNLELFGLMTGDEKIEETLRWDTINTMRLNNHISSQIEIDKIVAEGIKPVEITDNYDAGWLSPDGTFYGLNGSISNMLHNQIADALCAAGIIPVVDPKDPLSHNPDTWLERHGWAKIHGDWILYDGWNLHLTDDKNIPMTQKQQEQIYRYGQLCWKGLLKFGYSKEPISAARFNMTEIPMLRNYFEL